MFDDAARNVGIGADYVEMYGESKLARLDTIYNSCNYEVPDEAASFCTAQFDVVDYGASMSVVKTTGPAGRASDCFYYAIVDASVDVDALREQLDATLQTCRDSI